MASSTAKRFAPLRPRPGDSHLDLPRLRGIVFDMDGTLCEPQTYMFGEMRSHLKIPKSVDILQHIDSLPPPDQAAAHQAICDIETRAAALQVPQPNLALLMAHLDARALPKAICTRNFDGPVRALLAKFLPPDTLFSPIITRHFRPAKPHPAGILHIAAQWGLPDASGLIMVGDSIDDMTAGRRAGAATVLLANNVNGQLFDHRDTDLVIHRLDQLIDILDDGFQGREIAAS
ncbi:hypothetical protein CDD81_3321 [Ophiocordyceps australis]|uniref:HAD superfamily hydrolase n=1 Tax=Ophiocordyceps australis TaxID=1399860 RepID=A0A2C5XWP0_9HYPO|nr:hypothetical protein CDD81_3321 [Ophiocordyceps australis]